MKMFGKKYEFWARNIKKSKKITDHDGVVRFLKSQKIKSYTYTLIFSLCTGWNKFFGVHSGIAIYFSPYIAVFNFYSILRYSQIFQIRTSLTII